MNHFVYYHICALSYHVSKESFLVANRWKDKDLFFQVIAIFSLSTFKNLTLEEQQKIYVKINELRMSDVDIEQKRKWLNTCLEQLESLNEDNELALKRVKHDD